MFLFGFGVIDEMFWGADLNVEALKFDTVQKDSKIDWRANRRLRFVVVDENPKAAEQELRSDRYTIHDRIGDYDVGKPARRYIECVVLQNLW